jgi:hypothetical protein
MTTEALRATEAARQLGISTKKLLLLRLVHERDDGVVRLDEQVIAGYHGGQARV